MGSGARYIGAGRASTGTTDDICVYGDCESEQSRRFPVLPLCAFHALKVHEVIEMSLAMETIREQRFPAAVERQEILDRRERVAGVVDNWGRPGDPVPRKSVVYFIRFGGMVKIGWTSNLDRRLRALPHEEVLRVEPGSMQDEKRMHVACAEWRVKGEWFRDCPEFRAVAGIDTPLEG